VRVLPRFGGIHIEEMHKRSHPSDAGNGNDRIRGQYGFATAQFHCISIGGNAPG